MKEWTHKQLVRRMAKWLKVTRRMTVVMSELSTANSETPDVIGWASGARSVLIECKVSRSDFLGDHKKWFRRHEELGMGDERFLAVPAGLVRAEELPAGWGLLEVDTYVYRRKEAVVKPADKRKECIMLMSALRRLEISTAVYVVHEKTQESDNEGQL